MSGVNSIAPLPGGTPLVGAVGLSSTSPAIVVGQNSGQNSLTVALGNVGGVRTMNTQNGDLNMIMSDGMGIVESTGGNLLLHPYFPLTGTATSGTLVAGNLSAGIAWQGSGTPVLSTVAYVPGAVVISSGTTFVCLVAQPIGSVAPVNGANWQSIGGGSGGTPTSIANTGASLAIDTTGSLTYTTPNTASNLNKIELTTVVPTTTPGINAGAIVLTSGSSISLSAPNIIDVGNPTPNYATGMNLMSSTNGNWGNNLGYLAGNVVIDAGLLYLCIVNKSPPVSPAVNPNPASDPSFWKPFGGGSSITNTGATLAIDATGTLTFTNPNTASNVNQINISTTVPTTTPAPNAGEIKIQSAGGLVLSSPDAVGVDNPTANYSSGNVLMVSSTTPWANTKGYVLGNVVVDASVAYLCIQNKPPPTAPATNPAPSADPTFWQPLGGGGGGGSSITAGGSSLALNSTGGLSLTTTDVASNTNTVSIATTIPTTTPGTNAGRISISAGADLQLGCAVGDMTLTNTAGAGLGNIILSTANKIVLENTGASGITVKATAGTTPLTVEPPANFGTGDVPYNCGVFNNQYGYNIGSIVQETSGGGSYVCITAVAPNTVAPYNPVPSATPASWLPLGAGGGGMELAPGANATWSDTAGYAVGSVVNNTSPVGIYVCIQTVPTPTPPATNPNPSSSPSFWTELISNTTAPGSAMVYENAWSATQAYSAQAVVAFTSTSGTVINFICILAISAPVSPAVNPNPDVDTTHWLQFGSVVLSTSWSSTEQYNVGTILNDPQYGSFNCVLTAPPGSPAPWLQTTPIYWSSLTQGYCYFYGDYDLTGATPYPVGSIVNSGGAWWIANTIYVPPAPPVALPPINSTNTNWSFVVSTVSGLNGLAITNPYPIPPAVPSGTVLDITTSNNFVATPPFVVYTGNLGNTGFVASGTGIALVPGSRYQVSYDMTFNGIPNNNNISSATWQVRMTFNMTSTTVQATSYYDIYNSGSQGASGNAVPSANFSGSFVFTAPVDATFVGIQVQNTLDTGTGFPESTTNQICSVSFASLTNGLLITSLG